MRIVLRCRRKGFLARRCWGYYFVTSLSQCDPVVLQKDDFETIADHGIVVDHFADGCDQADDHLCRVVSRSSLREVIQMKLGCSVSVNSVDTETGYGPFRQS